MAKKSGYPGGMMPGNMNKMMKQVQKMQKEMAKMQEEQGKKEVEASAGGGAVTVTVNGKKQILAVKIKEDVVDKDDIEMLEDLILTATNQALEQADELMESGMSSITGGLNIPGMF